MKIKDTDTKSFNKLVNDAMKRLRDFEKEIRADERRKVLEELARSGRLKPEKRL